MKKDLSSQKLHSYFPAHIFRGGIMLSLILLFSLFSCSPPKLIGYETENIVNTYISNDLNLKSNFDVQMDLIRNISLNQNLLKDLNSEDYIIISNYSNYPFSINNENLPFEENISNEIKIQIENQLVASGLKVLEATQPYNVVLNNNFTRFKKMINFEILNFGIYYEQISDEEYIRHGICKLRLKRINKDGVIEAFSEVLTEESDTIPTKVVKSIESRPVDYGYFSQLKNNKLSIVSPSLLENHPIGIVDNRSPTETTNTKKVIKGIKFSFPSVKKSTKLYAVDYETFKELELNLKSPNSSLNISDINNLNTTRIKFNANEVVFNSDIGQYTAVISNDDLLNIFGTSKEIIILYKTRRICVLRKFENGSISIIE